MSELRREPEPGERLVRCKHCGRLDIPLNDVELWEYVRTGVGLGTECPHRYQGWHEWQYVADHPEPVTAERRIVGAQTDGAHGDAMVYAHGSDVKSPGAV